MPSASITRFAVLCWAVSPANAVLAATPDEIAALVDHPVIVTLVDGRLPQGRLSPKTNADCVVLLTDRPDIVLESRFAMRFVQDVALLPAVNPEPDRLPLPMLPGGPGLAPVPCSENTEILYSPLCGPHDLPMGNFLPIAEAMDYRQAVRSLRIETRIASWDRDAAFDGLLVRVQPLDGWGQMVPVDGSVDVELVTETKLTTGGEVIRRDAPFAITERWSTPIHAVDFDATGVIVKLPFRRYQPDRDFDTAPAALAMARLRLPSAGSFDAVDANVNLRPVSRFLDDQRLLQRSANIRYLP